MRFRVELYREAQKQLSQFPRDVRERMEHAIDEFEEKDDSQWSNIKVLQGAEWKGCCERKSARTGSSSGSIQSTERWRFSPSSSDPKDTYR
jgi:hypothetical protein